MAELHHDFANNDEVNLVTFTVDPERDTPAALCEYANRFGADAQHWLFLTGERDVLYPLIRDSFHLAVEQNQGNARTPGNEVAHSTRLVLVDRKGHIRGYFDGRRTDEQGMPVQDLPRLRKSIAALLREKP